eukprot:COSAG06_NODE_4351_length_4337_cov_48.628126_3_plen_98_part_00
MLSHGLKPRCRSEYLGQLDGREREVYLNDAWRSVMVAPGMTNEWGDVVASLSGSLRWVVELKSGVSVRIERRPAPRPCRVQRRWWWWSRGTKPTTVS